MINNLHNDCLLQIPYTDDLILLQPTENRHHYFARMISTGKVKIRVINGSGPGGITKIQIVTHIRKEDGIE
jgi:hypothetical protein